jgi:hypothetical protein
LVPALEDLVETWGRCLVIDGLGVFLRDVEGNGDEDGNTLSNERVWVEVRDVDLLR